MRMIVHTKNGNSYVSKNSTSAEEEAEMRGAMDTVKEIIDQLGKLETGHLSINTDTSTVFLNLLEVEAIEFVDTRIATDARVYTAEYTC